MVDYRYPEPEESIGDPSSAPSSAAQETAKELTQAIRRALCFIESGYPDYVAAQCVLYAALRKIRSRPPEDEELEVHWSCLERL